MSHFPQNFSEIPPEFLALVMKTLTHVIPKSFKFFLIKNAVGLTISLIRTMDHVSGPFRICFKMKFTKCSSGRWT